MNDRTEKLEAELSAMIPRPVATDAWNQIAAAIDAEPKHRWPDRCLLSAIWLGTIAACVILSVILSAGGSFGNLPAADPIAQTAPRFGSFPQALAGADIDVMSNSN